ncbi:nucleotide-diphospho-sugar transferase [Aspergillus tetrazonus]
MISEVTSRTTKAGHLLTHALRRKPVVFVLLAITLIALYPAGSPFLLPASTPLSPSTSEPLPQPTLAASLSARDLLSRRVSSDRTSIPKLIHQTWFPAGSNMSASAQAWVQTMRAQNADWEYVLWDDVTNELLVEQYFPWFLETYRSLPKEINRADMARNFYMYLFGGMYADVDTEALRPVNALFAAHEVPLRRHLDMLSALDAVPDVQRAFMGRMAHTFDPDGLGAVPNGWMASPPGHPFWLLPVLYVLENPKGDGSVEGMTGPGILGPLIKQYYSSLSSSDGGISLRRQLCARVQSIQPGWDLFCPSGYSLEETPESMQSLNHALILLPQEQVYPFSWVDDGDVKVCLGAKGNPQFDADKCKKRMGVDLWPSYFITYCTHTW